MTRDQLINKWLNECDPKYRDKMRLMLKTLDINELSRFFFLEDSKKGNSTMKISITYKTTQAIVKHQILKAKELEKNCTAN